MSLRDDAKGVLGKLFGSDVAKQVDLFDDPEKYPKDFLDECAYFLGRFIGGPAARKKMEPLYRKYAGGMG